MGTEVTYISNLKEVMGQIDSTARDRMAKAVVEVRNKALSVIVDTPKSGRMYYVPGTRTKYQASAPGESPASRTGRAGLLGSIKFGVEGSGDRIEGLVGSTIKYAPGLEYGTSNMAPRPWLRPAFEQSAELVKEIFAKEWFK